MAFHLPLRNGDSVCILNCTSCVLLVGDITAITRILDFRSRASLRPGARGRLGFGLNFSFHLHYYSPSSPCSSRLQTKQLSVDQTCPARMTSPWWIRSTFEPFSWASHPHRKEGYRSPPLLQTLPTLQPSSVLSSKPQAGSKGKALTFLGAAALAFLALGLTSSSSSSSSVTRALDFRPTFFGLTSSSSSDSGSALAFFAPFFGFTSSSPSDFGSALVFFAAFLGFLGVSSCSSPSGTLALSGISSSSTV